MLLSDFNYTLPPDLIALYPSEKRDHSRLMVLDKATDSLEHRRFFDIVDYLRPGDCLVLNDSKVLKARLRGFKDTGAAVEILLIRQCEGGLWEVMIKPGKRLKPGSIVYFDRGRREPGCETNSLLSGSYAEILDYGPQGSRIIRFIHQGDFMSWLDAAGEMPIPPYIARKPETIDNIRYQTVYSNESGSVAAPTAGLHFTEALLDKIQKMGVTTAKVTLHVGPGTFQPVKSEDIDDHKMHSEMYHISVAVADMINACRSSGGRIICVGTTAVRTLESAAYDDRERAGSLIGTENTTPDRALENAAYTAYNEREYKTSVKTPESVICGKHERVAHIKTLDDGVFTGSKYSIGKTELNACTNKRYRVKSGSGATEIFIKPGYSFKMCDCLITNFHLPKSTLLMLVSAIYGRERLLRAYSEAIDKGYRFFSYGDAMLIV